MVYEIKRVDLPALAFPLWRNFLYPSLSQRFLTALLLPAHNRCSAMLGLLENILAHSFANVITDSLHFCRSVDIICYIPWLGWATCSGPITLSYAADKCCGLLISLTMHGSQSHLCQRACKGVSSNVAIVTTFSSLWPSGCSRNNYGVLTPGFF